MRVLAAWLLVPLATLVALENPAPRARELTVEDRVAARKAIERVYWSHRLWPEGNGGTRARLEARIPDARVRALVVDDLRKSAELEAISGAPLDAAQLQAEVERMATHTRAPAVLRELFDALGNDSLLIAETLARPKLEDRLLRERITGRSDSAPVPCLPDSWTALPTGGPSPRYGHTAIWTGSEMIVWGGTGGGITVTGGRYDPATDSWTATTTVGAPAARSAHKAIWTGSEMIVWGGVEVGGNASFLASGGRYDPAADTWVATATAGAPAGRTGHAALWIGAEMVVWGGGSPGANYNDGARYDPSTDQWTAMASAGAPSVRSSHTAVWTGTQMLVWGGASYDAGYHYRSDGGRYSPVTDRWEAIATGGAPAARYAHTAVWTGSEMIVWGGSSGSNPFGDGARYSPDADQWAALSSIGAPSARAGYSTVWTGSEMILWGGLAGGFLDTGARYSPAGDTWVATSTNAAPSGRQAHTAVWTGSAMLVWGGLRMFDVLGDGGRYCVASCDVPSTWYPDHDGDGRGDAGVPQLACEPPAGSVGTGGDCDDSDGTVWGAPDEVADLRVSTTSAMAEVSWSTQTATAGPGTVYDLASGALPLPGEVLAWSSADCLQSNPTTSHTDERDNPESGSGYWYLARARNACAVGTYGGARDASLGACP